jgi:hypothetical protein
MKKLVLAFFLISGAAFSQDMNVIKGNFDFLKDQTEINTEFDYSNFTMMEEKKTEAQYVEEHKAELDKDTKGSGFFWEKKWVAARKKIWTPKFLEIGNIELSKAGKKINFKEGLNTPYTLIVQTIWIYPGFNTSIAKPTARVSTNLKFVETANKSNVLLEITSEEAPGNRAENQWENNFSDESRIGEGYAKTAKTLSKMIVKKAFK